MGTEPTKYEICYLPYTISIDDLKREARESPDTIAKRLLDASMLQPHLLNSCLLLSQRVGQFQESQKVLLENNATLRRLLDGSQSMVDSQDKTIQQLRDLNSSLARQLAEASQKKARKR